MIAPSAEVSHAGLHRAALVAGRAVIDAEDGEKLSLVLDDHAGAKLCRFDAAHMLPRKMDDFGNSCRQPALRCGARGITRGTLEWPLPSARYKYKWLRLPGSITPERLQAFRNSEREPSAIDLFHGPRADRSRSAGGVETR